MNCMIRRMTMYTMVSMVLLMFLAEMMSVAAQTCGSAVGGALCQDGLCCSKFGYCGGSAAYCSESQGCQSQCVSPAPPAPPAVSTSGLDKTVTEAVFEALFPNRNAFYTYNSFILAANAFPTFGTEGSKACRLREIAAFAAHVQQETAGLVYIREIDQSFDYCDATDLTYPCAPGQKYFGRGPLQLSWNFNYGPASSFVGDDILGFPDRVASDPVLAFKSSMWFWTTSSGSIPSIHDVLLGKFHPSKEDRKLGRRSGFGLTILIINGGLECGKVTPQATNRVKYFKQFAKQLKVATGPFLTCNKMTPY